MTDPHLVSVIIPTHNRKESLLCTLESLCSQTHPSDRLEVIVVDDGCSDGSQEIASCSFPFALRYLRQENRGGVVARNRGAESARGDLLVFLDDDMTARPEYLIELAGAFSVRHRLLARGRLMPWDGYASVFACQYAMPLAQTQVSTGDFSSNNLAIRHDDFLQLGGWRDVLPDAREHRGGIWSDLEFAVRASKEGFQLVTVDTAGIVHRDYAAQTLSNACQRAHMVSKLALPVIDEFPHLLPHIPMLRDKGPIEWHHDAPALILRKLIRQVASSRLVITLMYMSIPRLERHHPSSPLLRLFYRWTISSCIYRGYRTGLQERRQEARP